MAGSMVQSMPEINDVELACPQQGSDAVQAADHSVKPGHVLSGNVENSMHSQLAQCMT